jgi:hypothetical protein
MKVDGQKIVKTEKEIELEPAPKVAKKDDVRPGTAPTLRRPGENPENKDPVEPGAPSNVPISVPPPVGSPDPSTTGPNLFPAPAR